MAQDQCQQYKMLGGFVANRAFELPPQMMDSTRRADAVWDTYKEVQKHN